MKNGVPYTCSARSTAIERPGTSGTPCAPIGSSSLARSTMREKTYDFFCRRGFFGSSGWRILGIVRMRLHPFADALHRHLVLGDDVALDQHAADRRIRPAVVRIVVDAKNG